MSIGHGSSGTRRRPLVSVLLFPLFRSSVPPERISIRVEDFVVILAMLPFLLPSPPPILDVFEEDEGRHEDVEARRR